MVSLQQFKDPITGGLFKQPVVPGLKGQCITQIRPTPQLHNYWDDIEHSSSGNEVETGDDRKINADAAGVPVGMSPVASSTSPEATCTARNKSIKLAKSIQRTCF